MARVAIVHPEGLLGTEMRERLGETPIAVSLLTPDADPGAAVLSDFGGAAALVHEANAENLADAELVFVCGDGSTETVDLPVEEGTTVVHLGGPRLGAPVVAGVNAASHPRGEPLYSPPPGLVATTLVLQALQHLDPVAASAVIIDPVSTHGQAGLDELVSQTRGMLALGDQPTAVLGRQRAFLLTAGELEPGILQAIMGRILERPASIPVMGLRGGIFHGVSSAIQVSFAEETPYSELIEALESARNLEWRDDPQFDQLGVAGNDRVVVCQAEAAGANSVWLWTITDNLTRGSVLNAIEAAREIHPALLPLGPAAVG